MHIKKKQEGIIKRVGGEIWDKVREEEDKK